MQINTGTKTIQRRVKRSKNQPKINSDRLKKKQFSNTHRGQVTQAKRIFQDKLLYSLLGNFLMQIILLNQLPKLEALLMPLLETLYLENAKMSKKKLQVLLKSLVQEKCGSFEDLVQVPKNAALVPGTSAHLQKGDILTVWDLLHGMMLPSGNDAAFTLALHFGNLLVKRQNLKSVKQDQLFNYPFKIFVCEMNKIAKDLGLKNSIFNNPHGLSHKGNRSCAEDIGKLAMHYISYSKLQQVCNQQEYECQIFNEKTGQRNAK